MTSSAPGRPSWRGAVNGVLYTVQFHESLTRDLAADRAQMLLKQPLAGFTEEQQYDALREAVESGTDLTQLIPEPHSEQDFRQFLVLLIEELDALRPWPEPAFRALDVSRWDELGELTVIARLPVVVPRVEAKISTVFWKLDDLGKRAAVLRLTSSGAVVAFVAGWWPDSRNVALAAAPEHDPNAIIDELTTSTDLTSDLLTRIEN